MGAQETDNIHSKIWDYGRRLKLEFAGGDVPVLHRIEFKPRKDADADFREQDSDKDFSWSDVPKAVSIVILKYLLWNARGQKGNLYLAGKHRKSLAATFGDAITNEAGFVEVFSEVMPTGMMYGRVKQIFIGDNLHDGAKDKRDRRIRVQESYLPPDCISVYWDVRGTKALSKKEDFQALLELISKAVGVPVDLEPLEGEGSTPEAQVLPGRSKAPPSATDLIREPKQAPPPQTDTGNILKWMMHEFGKTLDVLRGNAREKAPALPTGTPPPPNEKSKPELPPKEAAKPAGSPFSIPRTEHAALPAIPKELFMVPPVNTVWQDDRPLIDFPDDDVSHLWTLKNSFEGILIIGRTGSGKTSGSGVAFAETFLRHGFGGLVLTVKEDEAEHWRRLCRRCGREQDLIVVTRGGKWKFNALAYEAQHPGRGSGLAENFTSLCKNLLRISTRSKGGGVNEQIWESAGDQLLNATFELFLLAGGDISFDRLAEFITAAPTDELPKSEEEWLKLPVFGNVLLKARNSLVTDEDKRVFAKAADYWFNYYRTRPQKMRASIVLAVSAMFDAFRGRDIPALISGETNVTPESIMSGKIVVIDLPLKQFLHAGLMVQSVWKYCFQIALERAKRANNPAMRPVFEWNDEGQNFFSSNDQHFQATARSSRVCRVILTQNLPSFYTEFGQGGREAANTVFGNLNTKVFHNNSDNETNRWAADLFGMEIHTRYTVTSGPEPQPKDVFDSIRQSFDPPDTMSVGGAEHWEYVVRPEEFNKLRTGGKENNFLVDAYITWMGLSAEKERHFTRITFEQNREL